MDNISSQIGAFELGDNLGGYGDGVLEAAGEFAGPSPNRTQLQGGCTQMCTFRCIGDAALEAAGANVAIGPSVGACRPPPTLLRCVSDSALEMAGENMAFGPSIACGPTVSGEGMTCRPGPR